ncbi:uncharacterized protein LAESUDRAFT_714984 [Laetiporus sulphureus 93-53]|uniref:Uncharacterized protein n=1 Tax=Laetiporus sulphureus 93-53 TaxID=1314785 RepID=A0A165DRI5_9APHY|nr:uncharacterized protein LAESUDRAFT_714984 [Laetiporus sulphureus 93-53]KZT05476.1 hypothetical protein LAESUDRAFT_714984 [Laetiporus sulphureus 93-53]
MAGILAIICDIARLFARAVAYIFVGVANLLLSIATLLQGSTDVHDSNLQPKDELEGGRDDVERLRSNVKRLQRQLADAEKQIKEEKRRELGEMDQINNEWKIKFSQLEQQVSVRDQKIVSMGIELQNSQRQNAAYVEERERIQALSEARRIELLAAQSYFNTADTTSESDVVRIVQTLNAEIFKTTKAIADLFKTTHKEKPDDATLDQARKRVGQHTARLLMSSVDHEQDTVFLETAVQAAIVEFSASLTSAWDLEFLHVDTMALAHRQMRITETPSVAGRWRALAHKYEPQSSRTGHTWEEMFFHSLLASIAAVLTLAKGSQDAIASVQDNLRVLVRTILALRKMIGEEIVGTDYVVTIGVADERFVPDNMEDALDPDVKGDADKAGSPVFCPSDLGLLRVEKPTADVEENQLSMKTLIRHKVVLKRTIQELLAEANLSEDEIAEVVAQSVAVAEGYL